MAFDELPHSSSAETMAIDQQPLKRKRGRPAGSQVAQSKMEYNMPLALLDDGGSSSSSSSNSDKDDDFVPTDDELAIVAQKPVEIHCGGTEDDAEDAIPIKIVRPRRARRQKINLCCGPQRNNSQHIGTGICTSTEASDVNGQKIHASVRGNAMVRAEELLAKLPENYPSFIKRMLKSHVVQGFWLGLPLAFCKKHLPNFNVGILLEDEDGQEHHTTYLGAKVGLSGGWAGFATSHHLEIGDVVVFQLVQSRKFKVYITREHELNTTDDRAPDLLRLEASKESCQSKDDFKYKEDAIKDPIVDHKAPTDDGTGLVNEATTADDGIRVSDVGSNDDGATVFRSFNIVVGSLVLNSEFREDQQRTYYELCRSQRSPLHEHLLKELNLTLVMGMIMETINIADRIRACAAAAEEEGAAAWPCRGDLVVWKKTLESFLALGMNVAFLINRVDDLLRVSVMRSRELAEWDKYKEVKLERARAGRKARALELRLSGVKDALEKMDAEMEEVEESARSDRAFQQLVTAPW
ncbi:hypothetical protein ACP4OV_016638 [Aristida adscensionis]